MTSDATSHFFVCVFCCSYQTFPILLKLFDSLDSLVPMIYDMNLSLWYSYLILSISSASGDSGRIGVIGGSPVYTGDQFAAI